MIHARNLPNINVTIYRHQAAWLAQLQRHSALGKSRIMREIIEYARLRGYTPGNVSLGDAMATARDRATTGQPTP